MLKAKKSAFGVKRFKVSILLILLIFGSCEYFFPPLNNDKISVKEAHNFLIRNRDNREVVILDVRSKPEYDKFHLADAILLDYKETTFPGDIEKLDRSKRYIIISTGNNESYNTLELMKELKFTKIHAVTGGIDEWKKENLPKDF